ncbi:unnamed protein product [Schistosoma bovis]|uniref:Trematode Eggshell Synthesis domain containing protein n=1 Tax=Schistosoma bovis TaxID=6184 RepID=A0A430QLT9_SCHBO|nr:uncharacterized protein DC041_0009390 [Schistosoma bovis]CAH8556947.1 unnamed protein product [Schistosoma bovis]
MEERTINLHLILLITYITINLVTLGNTQMSMSDSLMETIDRAQNEAMNVTSREESSSGSGRNDMKLIQSDGNYYKKRQSNKAGGKRYEGLFYSRGYSIFGDIDSETTTFQYGGKITKYGKRSRKYSDRDTIGSSDRYSSSYIKDDFKIRAKSKKKYAKDYNGMSEMTGRDMQISGIRNNNENKGRTETNKDSQSRESRNRTEDTRNFNMH